MTIEDALDHTWGADAELAPLYLASMLVAVAVVVGVIGWSYCMKGTVKKMA